MVHLSDDSAVTTNYPQLVENGCTIQSALSTTNGAGFRTITGTIDIAKMHGVSRQKLFSDDTYWGTASVAAADNIFINCIAANPAVENGTNVELNVELRFKAVLMGTRIVAQS